METSLICASHGTDSRAGEHSLEVSDGATVLSGRGWGSGGVCSRSVSVQLPCAASGGCEATGQRFYDPVPAHLPEVDVGPAFVVLPAGLAHAIFLCALHQGLHICYVLCYTLNS